MALSFRSHPPREALDEGTFDGTLRIIIASDAGVEALTTAASGTEILNVEIRTMEETADTAPGVLHIAGDTREQAIPEGVLPDSDIRTAEEAGEPDSEDAGPEKLSGDDKKQSSSADKTREIKNLRVDIHQLDHIMNLIEDLVINRGRLRQIAAQHKIKEMDEAIGMVDRSVSELHSLMMNIRMIPLTHIFNRLPRVAGMSRQYDGKEVEFVIDGGETELDRSVMDGLNDPLLHLIRNAVNHGIESPDAA